MRLHERGGIDDEGKRLHDYESIYGKTNKHGSRIIGPLYFQTDWRSASSSRATKPISKGTQTIGAVKGAPAMDAKP